MSAPVLDRPDPEAASNNVVPQRSWLPMLWTLPPVLVVLGIAGYPILRVLTESTRTPTGRGTEVWTSVLGSAAFLDALWRTVSIAVCATAGCLVLGTFLAIVLAFVPFPGSGVVGRLIDTILTLPSFLITLAFTFLYGTAGAVNALLAELTGATSPVVDFLTTPLGVILAEITYFTPFVVRPLLAAFAQLPREQLDVAASLGASPWRVLRQVVLPEAWPALAAGGSLVLLLTLNEFGIVLFTGAKGVITLPALIYTRGIVTFDLPGAAVLASVQVLLSLSLYLAYRFVFARFTARPKGN
ncbi:2-aminoethylphosphonate ABC transporter permease subunit [Nocardia asteroides NBRC 15531]|uniref:ABC transporter permease protein n=1 Tax=Nocardia asteroides NBRC 15531 TaxID=1110697 RepID=U5E6R5_NOCAS|nr:2-aminoethylphosphonate ABC transporter permease subunit [Nocardia asteroides]TLF64618.1 2-aminoethylphosphonate ABC transporter permease subunit [Nocardia asteroides NBRC 15531]UGT50264.1 2-aminoethylphosphonate ABC transporter permease subunit [Nocardia asteroides]SFN13785.1 2-aminoethylphosphonate transport system permease protein [Nocardia asteroides]VEG36954.1 Sulfate transport system permease protein CysW [Nocardia asteroides]GAD81991.1 putative ABC transporter permease protein [Nocar